MGLEDCENEVSREQLDKKMRTVSRVQQKNIRDGYGSTDISDAA